MGLKSFFNNLFDTRTPAADSAGPVTDYQGYTIRPTPKAQGGVFLTAGVISKTFPEGVREQSFIRADTHVSHADACAHAIQKAQRIIDEQGDALFSDR